MILHYKLRQILFYLKVMWCDSWFLVFHYKNKKISLAMNRIDNGKYEHKKSSQQLLRALVARRGIEPLLPE